MNRHITSTNGSPDQAAEATDQAAEATDPDSSFEIHSNDDLTDRNGAVSNDKSRPPVVIDRINKAARTILDHNEAHKAWTNADYPEIPGVLKKIMGPNHYISAAAKHDFLKKFQ